MHYPRNSHVALGRFPVPVSQGAVCFLYWPHGHFIINWGSSAIFLVLLVFIVYTAMWSSFSLCWFTSYYHLISAQIIMFPVLRARRAEVSCGMPGWQQQYSLTSSFAGISSSQPHVLQRLHWHQNIPYTSVKCFILFVIQKLAQDSANGIGFHQWKEICQWGAILLLLHRDWWSRWHLGTCVWDHSCLSISLYWFLSWIQDPRRIRGCSEVSISFFFCSGNLLLC